MAMEPPNHPRRQQCCLHQVKPRPRCSQALCIRGQQRTRTRRTHANAALHTAEALRRPAEFAANPRTGPLPYTSCLGRMERVPCCRHSSPTRRLDSDIFCAPVTVCPPPVSPCECGAWPALAHPTHTTDTPQNAKVFLTPPAARSPTLQSRRLSFNSVERSPRDACGAGGGKLCSWRAGRGGGRGGARHHFESE